MDNPLIMDGVQIGGWAAVATAALVFLTAIVRSMRRESRNLQNGGSQRDILLRIERATSTSAATLVNHTKYHAEDVAARTKLADDTKRHAVEFAQAHDLTHRQNDAIKSANSTDTREVVAAINTMRVELATKLGEIAGKLRTD